jgi:hypothetical protein
VRPRRVFLKTDGRFCLLGCVGTKVAGSLSRRPIDPRAAPQPPHGRGRKRALVVRTAPVQVQRSTLPPRDSSTVECAALLRRPCRVQLTCFWGDEPELHVSLADSQERWLDDRGTIEGFRTQWRPFLDASPRLLTRFPALLRKQPSPSHRAERFRRNTGGAIHSSTLSDRDREKKRKIADEGRKRGRR